MFDKNYIYKYVVVDDDDNILFRSESFDSCVRYANDVSCRECIDLYVHINSFECVYSHNGTSVVVPVDLVSENVF